MDLQNDIKNILEIAVHAPSGDNSQPWRFILENKEVYIFNFPEQDASLYNFQQKASMVAHGALIENILIASSALGYHVTLKLFSNQTNANHVANIIFEPTTPKEEPLLPFISERATNRKPYDTTPLTEEEKTVLTDASRSVGIGKVRFVEHREGREVLAKALAMNERLVFEIPKLHHFFFNHIRWSNREAKNRRDGFDIKTLELPPPLRLAFWLFKCWTFLKVLNRVGLSRSIPMQTAKLYLASAAFCAITMSENSSEGFLMGGRVMQRVWLEATRMGLSVQPLTGILFLVQRILKGATEELSRLHIQIITDAYKKITDTFGLEKEETVVFLFRVGRSEPPSARTVRFPLEDVVNRQ